MPADAGAVPGARVRAGHVQGGAAVHVGDHRAAVHLQRGDSRRDQFVLCAVPVLGHHAAHVERIPGRRDRILAGGSAQPQRPGEVRPVAAVPGDHRVLLLDDDRRAVGVLRVRDGSAVRVGYAEGHDRACHPFGDARPDEHEHHGHDRRHHGHDGQRRRSGRRRLPRHRSDRYDGGSDRQLHRCRGVLGHRVPLRAFAREEHGAQQVHSTPQARADDRGLEQSGERTGRG